MSGWGAAFARVPDLLAAHVAVSFAALLLALVIAAPLALWARGSARVRGVTLGFASLVQTIPGLALLALFFPLLLGLGALTGSRISPLGFLPALLALTLYALLPILRNAVTGLMGVDPAARDAADALGMTATQKLRLVELPLALPVIVAGVRTAAVWTIGAATLATAVGQPTLGDLIFAGLQTQNWTLVLAGCIASAALAMVVDLLIGFAERALATGQGKRAGVALAGLVAIALAAITLPLLKSGGGRETITIGAKGFTEQYILSRLIGARLEAAGYAVRYRDGLGSAVVFGALSGGEIDITVDYAGTLWTNEMKRSDTPEPKAMMAAIGSWAESKTGARLVGPLGFENAYAFAVTPETARRYRLKTLADMARESRRLRFATDPEFLERPEWASVRRAYPGIGFAGQASLNPGFLYDALKTGQADVVTAYTSDGRVAADGLVILADPSHAVPGYDALLLVNRKRAGDARLMAAIRPLVGAVRVEWMRQANYSVDRSESKRSPAEAAATLDTAIQGAP